MKYFVRQIAKVSRVKYPSSFLPKVVCQTSDQARLFELTWRSTRSRTPAGLQCYPIAKVMADRAVLNNEIHHRNSPAEITRAAKIYEILR